VTTRAVLYARVSTEEQGQGYSLPTQLEAAHRYAADKGYAVIDEVCDMHTGTVIERPGLKKVYDLAQQKAINLVIVYDLDRLSREVGNQAIIEMELAGYGTKIEYVLGQYGNGPEGELLKVVKAGIAQYENRQRVERSRRGRRGKAAAGYVVCPAGRAPFGYDYRFEPHKGWLVINEDQAVVVRQMYKWLVQDGLSSYAIAKKLWENHILSKGDYSPVVYKKTGRGEWSPSTVRRILSNEVYKGEWYYGRTATTKINGKKVQRAVPKAEWIKVAVPPVVDDQTWVEAQDRPKYNRIVSKRNIQRQYLLRSLVFCPCGRRWTAVYKGHLKRAYYRCPTNEAEHWRHRCDMRNSIRQETLEGAVWDTIRTFFLDPNNLKIEIKRRRQRAKSNVDRLLKRQRAIEAAITNNDRQMAKLLDQWLTDGFSKAVITDHKNALVNQRAELETEARMITAEQASATISKDDEAEILKLAGQVSKGLAGMTFERKRRLLELLRLRIDVIDKDTVRVGGVISDGLVVNLCLAGSSRGR
jgi:site-specific DNA recombinase